MTCSSKGSALKIGLISDLHADLSALDTTLDHLSNAQVDQILCAGDLVDFGISGDAVVRRINAAGIPCVQGNHDRMARDTQRLRQRQGAHGQKTALLRPETLGLLDDLPALLRFEWADTTFMLTHSAPWGRDIYVYPESTTPLLRRVVREGKADVIMLGHTHRPMWIELEGCTICNPGSISQNYGLDTDTFGILSLPDRTFSLFDVQNGDQVQLIKDRRQ